MSYTVTKQMSTVFGDQRVIGYEITSDGATAEIDTGLEYITHIQKSIKSANTYGAFIAANVNSTGSASLGTLTITGSTSGDAFYVTVYGR